MIDLKSSVSGVSRYVTQIIHFKDGQKRTLHGVDTETINQGQFTKFKTKDGRFILINDNNVNMIEVFEEPNDR